MLHIAAGLLFAFLLLGASALVAGHILAARRAIALALLGPAIEVPRAWQARLRTVRQGGRTRTYRQMRIAA